MEDALIEALRSVVNGMHQEVPPERLQALIDIGLVQQVVDGYQVTWAGKHRLGSASKTPASTEGAQV